MTCPPWQVISVLHVHNPTVSKRLRYPLNQNICVRPGGAVACSPYSVTIFSFARFLPSFFNKLGCTAKVTSICCEGLQMLMFVYCGKFQMLMCFYRSELQMLMHIYCGELQMLMHIHCGGLQMLMHIYCGGLQMLMHIYCGGLQIPHGDKPMDFASSSVTSVSLFFKVRQPAR